MNKSGLRVRRGTDACTPPFAILSAIGSAVPKTTGPIPNWPPIYRVMSLKATDKDLSLRSKRSIRISYQNLLATQPVRPRPAWELGKVGVIRKHSAKRFVTELGASRKVV